MAKLFTNGKAETVATQEWVKSNFDGTNVPDPPGGTPPDGPEQPSEPCNSIPEAPDDGKQYGRQEGQWTEIKRGRAGRKGDKGDPGTFLLEVEYDDGSPWAFNPQGVVCDGDGQPTTKTVGIDHILVPIFCLPPTGWDKLKALTHEESLARVARDAEAGLPTVQMLTFWEYRNLHPDGMSREEYGISRKWRFEYDGTEWLPVECVDQTGGFEDDE